MRNEQAYKEIVEAFVASKVKSFGQIALDKAISIREIQFDPNGKVVSFYGDPVHAIGSLLLKFEEIAGKISTLTAKAMILNLLFKYPDLELPPELK